MKAWYQPGESAVAVAPHAIVMAGAERAADLTSLLEGSPTPLEVLSLLSGGDVARLPDFAAVVVEGDDLVVLARGPFRITYGESQWSGADTATWREHRVAAAVGDEVVLEQDDAAEQATGLPVRCGVVLAGHVAWIPDLEVEHAERQPPAVEQEAPTEAPLGEDEPLPEEEPLAEDDSPDDDESQAEDEPSDAVEPVAEGAPDPEVTRVEADDAFDAMFGATVHGRVVQDAAMREPDLDTGANEIAEPTPEPEADASPAEPGPAAPETRVEPVEPAAPDASTSGDHDGRTITALDLQRLREERAGAEAETAPPSAVVPSPSARLAMSNGETVDLDRPVLIGRSPRAAQMSSSELPHLVVVDDPYVSGTHIEVSFQGTSLVAIDRSTNGTTVTRPGHATERLTRDEPRALVDGCVLGLSDDLTATVAFHEAGR